MTRKVKVSLNINCDLIARARLKRIDLDETFENALRRLGCEVPAVAEARAVAWRLENREAIQQSNEHTEKHGLWWESYARARTRGPKSGMAPRTP